MALENLAAIADALGQRLAPKLYYQWNRAAVAAALIPAIPYRGKNCAFAAEFSGDVDAATVGEGSDVEDAEFDSDEDEDATLGWAHYRKSTKVTETAIDAAATSDGVAPSDLVSLYETRVLGQSTRLVSKINRDIYAGTGTDGSNPTIVGLFGGSTDDSGNYAGVSRSSRAEWKGNVLANGGSARALTIKLLYQADQALFEACGEGATHILCSPGVHQTYSSLFEIVRRNAGDRGPLRYEAGSSELFFKGVPLIRDKDCPAGKLIFVNVNYLRVQFLPRAGVPNDAVVQQMRNLMGSTGGSEGAIPTATAIPFRLALLAKTGDSTKLSLKQTLQLVVNRPNAFCQVTDISEAA